MTRQELLAHIPLFESLTPEDLDALARRMDEGEFAEGEAIVRQGDPGSALFIIDEGAVEISYGEGKGRVVLSTLYNGQYFGELSLFDGAPRSATATAMRRSRLVRLDREDLVDFVNRNPSAALRIIAEMSERLRQTNELMSRQVSRNVLAEEEERLTLGQRVADRVAAFGGSWAFLGLFSVVITAWMVLNVMPVAHFDPYPYILLNLALNALAAVQAPIIMMSQNRQASKDKLLAANDYQVNLKAETEIAALMRGQAEMLARLAFLERLVSRRQTQSLTSAE